MAASGELTESVRLDEQNTYGQARDIDMTFELTSCGIKSFADNRDTLVSLMCNALALGPLALNSSECPAPTPSPTFLPTLSPTPGSGD